MGAYRRTVVTINQNWGRSNSISFEKCVYISSQQKCVCFLTQGCYYQICGVSVDELLEGPVGSKITMNPKSFGIGNKRPGSELSKSSKRPKIDVLPWTQMLYGRPVYSSDGKILASLPPNHCLNTDSCSSIVSNAFAQRSRKIHWRVQRAIPLFKALIKNHQQCNYKALIDYYCPIFPQEMSTDKSVLELETPSRDVAGFLKAIMRRVVPLSLLGGSANMNVFVDSTTL
jgi:hypothetical protein